MNKLLGYRESGRGEGEREEGGGWYMNFRWRSGAINTKNKNTCQATRNPSTDLR